MAGCLDQKSQQFEENIILEGVGWQTMTRLVEDGMFVIQTVDSGSC